MLLSTLRNALSAALVLCILFVGLFNFRLYTAPTSGAPTAKTAAALRHIRYSLDLGAGADMQRLFPEGDYFSYVLYGLAQVNVGLQQPQGTQARAAALTEARWAWHELGEPHALEAFQVSAPLQPSYGIFYRGWRNYLLTGILLLQADNERDLDELRTYQEECAAIARALRANDHPFLQAYPNATWPVDTFPAMVSLFAHRQLVDSQYDGLVQTWLSDIKQYQAATGQLLPHRVSAADAAPRQTARATSQTLILRFLYELDPDYAESQYQQFRKQHVDMVWGMPGALEYPLGTSGFGDVDSGPLLAGVSLSATTVLLGTSQIFGDTNVSKALWNGGEFLGFPLTINGMRQYWFGILPVGDAFVVWSQTSHPWLQPAATDTYPNVVPSWWRLPWHLLSLCIVLLAWGCLRRLRQV